MLQCLAIKNLSGILKNQVYPEKLRNSIDMLYESWEIFSATQTLLKRSYDKGFRRYWENVFPPFHIRENSFVGFSFS